MFTTIKSILSTYGATAVLRSVPSSAWNLSFGAAQPALGLLDEVQLFIQGVLLKLELLQYTCGGLQFLLQTKDGSVFRFDFIHLWCRMQETVFKYLLSGIYLLPQAHVIQNDLNLCDITSLRMSLSQSHLILEICSWCCWCSTRRSPAFILSAWIILLRASSVCFLDAFSSAISCRSFTRSWSKKRRASSLASRVSAVRTFRGGGVRKSCW